MSTQFHCKNRRRRQLVLKNPPLNGIDYLEVLDREAPPGSPRQKTLLVHFLTAAPPLHRQNVRISGGVRVTPVKVLWAALAPDVTAPPASADEMTLFTALPHPERVLIVRTDSSGDFSSYRLSIVPAAGDASATKDLDPQLSAVDFSFKVECPSEFDCKPNDICPPESLPAPDISYLAKDYESFRRLMLDRLAFTLPQWSERHASDLGIALVEVLAYAADHLSYYQDAVTTEAYLGTARRRTSVRRHVRLLDYPMGEGNNARVWVAFAVTANVPLKQGTQLLTKVQNMTPRLQPNEAADAVMAGAEVFETLHDAALRPAQNEMLFHTWGDEQCCLPRGATRATLKDPGKKLGLQPGDVLIFEEVKGAGTGAKADANFAHRHAVRLVRVSAGVDPIGTPAQTALDVAEVEWSANDALPFPLCLSGYAKGKLIADVSVARGNVVLADHGQTIAAEKLFDFAGASRYRPQLKSAPLVYATPYAHARVMKQPASFPASAMLAGNAGRARPAITLRGLDNQPWHAQLDLLNSDRFAREFAVESEDDGSAQLRFGDGNAGRLPEDGLTATYRIGDGSAGNVGADAIFHVVSSDSGIASLRNPIAAAGSTKPEPLAQVRLYAPQAFRVQERAVTEADYAAVSQRHPDVQRAVATRRWTGSWNTMFITVDRKGGRSVDAEFEQELRDFLERFRLAGQDLEIDGPTFVPLDLELRVCVLTGYLRSEVKKALLEKFSVRELPDGSRGFFHPDNFTFGQPVYLSAIVAAAMQVQGVHWVEVARFRRWSQLPAGEIDAGQMSFARLEIARLDNDPNAPENGKLEFVMEGGA